MTLKRSLKVNKIYWKQNGIIKRLNNFAVYLFCAIVSLIVPVAVDTILYRTLKEQFEKEKKDARD